MIIKTRKLPPTQSEPARMRATAVDMTATLTIAYPHQADDPHASVALMLAKAYGYGRVEKILAYNQFQAREMSDKS